jgi:hypothetical protein
MNTQVLTPLEVCSGWRTTGAVEVVAVLWFESFSRFLPNSVYCGFELSTDFEVSKNLKNFNVIMSTVSTANSAATFSLK